MHASMYNGRKTVYDDDDDDPLHKVFRATSDVSLLF